MAKENKVNELDAEIRMNRVFEMMLYEHLSWNEFRDKASKEFSITPRQAENLWKEARTRLKERFERNNEQILEDHLNQLYDLLKRCRDDNNKRTEREVLADIAKVQGMEKTKVDITSGGNPIAINIKLD
jgi:uncharacterized protein YcbK (DUF882 family)